MGVGVGVGNRSEITAAQLEVALLDRGRAHRAFRRLTGTRLESLLTEAIAGRKTEAITEASADAASGDSGDGAEGARAPGTPETPGGTK
jgi:proteasome alpha subunit